MQKYCIKCGSKLIENDKFCPNCHTPIIENYDSPKINISTIKKEEPKEEVEKQEQKK